MSAIFERIARLGRRRGHGRRALDRALAVTDWKMRGSFVLAFACLGVVGTLSVLSAVRLDNAVAWVAHTQEIIGSAKTLLAAVTDAETEERGYIITGDESYLALYRQAAAKVTSETQRLRALIADEPAGQHYLSELEPQLAERLLYLERMVDVRRTQGFEAARDAIAGGPSRVLHARIQTRVEELAASELSLLTQRQRVARGVSALVNTVIVGGVVATAAVIGLVLFALRRDFAARLRAERQMRATQEDLEARVRERTLDLEQSARDMRAEAVARREAQSKLRQAYEDLRQSQLEMLQLERLRALGQLAGGIAHDINNTISPITLYVESLLEDEPSLSTAGRRQVDIIGRAIGAVAQTVARMREFSRQLEPHQTILRPLALNQLLEQVVELTRARWSDTPQQQGVVIEMRTQLMTDLPVIMGIEGELRDALVNLVFNAVDAMPKGGPLTLTTSVVSASADRAHLYEQAVCLEVRDEGVGMDEDTRQRCMEPFFSTKGARGSGLGLAMVYGTMQRHGVGIEIDSMPGHGTTFRFRFPITSAPAVEAAPTLGPAPTGLHILVIDDDPLVAAAVRETLLVDAHRVSIADGGQAGIDAFLAAQSAGDPYRVVMSDMGMPHVDGQQVALAVKAADPQAIVILLTGWGQRLDGEGGPPPHIDRVMSKPPTRAALRAALSSCLEESNRRAT